MTLPLTLAFGTYTFPNQTFQVMDHKLDIDTPVSDVRRKDGGVALDGYLKPKKIRINGKLWEGSVDSLYSSLNILQRAVHNRGQAAALYYKSDRYLTARLSSEGISNPYEKGLNEYLVNVDLVFVAEKPTAESATLRTVSGSRTNNSTTTDFGHAGTYPSRPVITFIAGHTFTNDLYLMNLANSHYFRYSGRLVNGQTLVIDCDAGCVLLHSGAEMIDAQSLLSGYLNLQIEDGGTNQFLIDAATLSFSATYRDRFYI